MLSDGVVKKEMDNYVGKLNRNWLVVGIYRGYGVWGSKSGGYGSRAFECFVPRAFQELQD